MPRSYLSLLPLLALAVGTLYTVASILPVPTNWLWFYCATPIVAVGTFALIFVVTSPRFGRFLFVAALATPMVSGFVPALVPILGCADPTKAFELGVVASLPIVLGALPVSIAAYRGYREGFRTSTAVRRLWLVTATSLAITTCLFWNPPETVQPSELGFAPIVWEPPRLVWLDEFRRSAVIAFIILAAATLTVIIVTKLDYEELARVDTIFRARSATAAPVLGPYRRADVGEDLRGTAAPLRRAVRIDLGCMVVAVASVLYLVARLHHLESRMEVATGTDVETGTSRAIAFPSLRHACSLVSTFDNWNEVNGKLALAHATHERIGVGDYRWQPAPPRPRRSRGSCHVTFAVDRVTFHEQSVRSVKFSENETTD